MKGAEKLLQGLETAGRRSQAHDRKGPRRSAFSRNLRLLLRRSVGLRTTKARGSAPPPPGFSPATWLARHKSLPSPPTFAGASVHPPRRFASVEGEQTEPALESASTRLAGGRKIPWRGYRGTHSGGRSQPARCTPLSPLKALTWVWALKRASRGNDSTERRPRPLGPPRQKRRT